MRTRPRVNRGKAPAAAPTPAPHLPAIMSLDPDFGGDLTHAAVELKISTNTHGLPVHVVAKLNNSRESNTRAIYLTVFADGLSEAGEAFDLQNNGVGFLAEFGVIDGLADAFRLLAEALRKIGVDRESGGAA